MINSVNESSTRNERGNTQSLGELPSFEFGLIRAHVFASLVTLVISVLFGILVATKFSFPEFLGGHGWLTWAGFATTIRRVFSSDGWAMRSWRFFITLCTPGESAGVKP